MKNLFTNLMKSTAKRAQNTGGGASQSQTSRSEGARQITARFESAQMKNTSLISGCSAVDVPMPSYGASDEHPMSTRSASDERRWNSREWKYVACILMVLVLSIGQMWGQSPFNVTPSACWETKDGILVAGNYQTSNKMKNNTTKSLLVNNSAIHIFSENTNITGISFDVCRNSDGSSENNAVSVQTSTGGAYSVPTSGFTATKNNSSLTSLSNITAIGRNQSTVTSISISFSSPVKAIEIVKASASSVANISITYSAPSASVYYAASVIGSANDDGEVTTDPGEASVSFDHKVTSTKVTLNGNIYAGMESGNSTINLGSGHSFQVGDQIIFNMTWNSTSSGQIGGVIIKATENITKSLTNVNSTEPFEVCYVVTADDGIAGRQSCSFTRTDGKSLIHGVRVVRASGGGGVDPEPECEATADAGADKSTTVGVGVAMAATAASSGYTGAWSIKSGSPSTATSQLGTTSSNTMTFTPNTYGTYTLVWTVTDDSDGSCSASDEATVTVPAPTHAISYTNTKGAANSNPATYSEGTGIASFAKLRHVVGYDFTGWSPSSISSSATTDQTIEAQWSANAAAAGTGTLTYALAFSSGTITTSSITRVNGALYDATDVSLANTSFADNATKTGCSGKLTTTTAKGGYVEVTFKIADGYTFTPTEVRVQGIAVTTNKTIEVELTDNADTPNSKSVSGTLTAVSSPTTGGYTVTLDFDESDPVVLEGTVTAKIYAYGATDSWRMGTPFVITGTLAPAAPLSTTNPSSASYVKGASATALSVTASGGTTPYSYQWYSCDDAEKTNPSTVGNSASYTPGTTSTGTGYYYCTVTDAASSSVSSSVATITVRDAYAPTASPAAGAVASGTAITLSSSDGGTIYYTTNGDTPNDESTAYDSEAKPTITTATTIKAVAKVNGYLGSVLTAAYTIKPTPGLAYGTSTVNKTNGDANFTNSLTNPNSVSVTYSSSDEDVATVDSDGEVTIKKYGSATITASFAGDATYLAQEVSYTLHVAKRTYRVTYNAGTGTITGSHSNDTKTEDETLTLPGVTFTQSGYLQTGWAESDGGSIAYDLEDSYTDNAAADLYPVWSEVYAVEEGSISNGSITISPTSAIAGATISLTASASLGYVFDSWTITKTSDKSDVTSSVSLSGQTTSASFTMPAYDVTVTAAFEEVTYTLSYNNGGASSGSVPSTPAADSYAAGTEITVPGSGSLEKTGCTFRGWTDGTTFYLAGQKFNISGNTTLTAVWDGGLSCTTLAQVAVKSDYTMNDIVGSSVISGFDSKGQSQVGSTTEYANKLGSSGYVRISPKDGSSFAAGDKISIRIYNGKTSTKSTNVALLQSDGSTKTELTAKSMDANTATTFEHTLVAAEISATGYVQVMRGESNGDGGWFISATIEHCVKTNFTVSFNMKGHGSAQDSYVGVPTGKKIVAPDAPEATGYTFGGWYTDSDCKTAVDWSTMTITADKTLYAKWTANSYAINYYDKGGSAFSGSHADGYPTTHTYGTGTDLESATKSCYTFGGWYTASDCSTGLVTSLGATDYTAAINLYAKWTLDLGVTTEPDETVAATVDVATEIGLTANGVSTYQWQVCDDDEGTNATDITGLDTEYSDYDEATLSFTPASAGTYYLRCKIADACSNVDYSHVVTVTASEAYDITMGTHTNGSFTIQVGSADAVSTSTSSGAGATIAIAATPSSGYAFKKWEILDGEDDDVTSTVGATADASTSFMMPSYAVTINAVFVATHTVTVTYGAGGSAASAASSTVGETLTTTITATAATGYNFSAWEFTSNTGSATLDNTASNPATLTMGTANVTVNATFSAKTYSVSLDQGIGSSGSENVTMTYNSSSHTSITAPTAPTGYTFAGWYTAAGGTGSMVMNASGVLQASVDGYTDGSGNWTKDATCTLYAKYTANYPEGYLYITDVMATPETKAGYTITASKTDADYNGELDGSFSHSGLQHWAKASVKKTGVYTLTFSDALTASATAAGVAVDVWWGSDNGDSNAGTKVYINGTADSDEIGYQKTDSKTRQQLLEGLKNLQAVGTTSVSSLQLKCTDNDGSTWFRVGIKEIPGYLLTYDDGDGTGAPAASYQPNATITLSSTAPTRSGYIFRGWQVGGSGTVYQPGDEFSMPAEAVTLVAKWDGVCMNFAAATSGSSETPAGTPKEISTATGGYASTLSGGSMTFLGRVGVIGCNNSYGLVFDSKDDELLTVTLSGAMLEAGAIIVLDCYSLKNSTTGKAVGFTINGNACVEGNYTTTENAYQPFTRTYVVKEDDGIDGKCTFTIEGATTDKVYLKSMMVAGCTSCTSITPTITGATTLYTYPSVTSTTLTLDKDGSTGGVTWSVTPASGVVTLSGSGTTVTVTAVATGTATITASIDPDGEHCGASVSQEISVAGCDILPIASVVLTSNTTADELNATAIISGFSGAKKLNDDGAKFGMTLSGDSPFKEGDIINITGTMDESPTSTTFAVYSSETASAANLLYTTTLSASDPIDVNIEVTEGNLTKLNTSKKVVVIRTKTPSDGQYNQNPHMAGIYLKRYSCSEGLAEFTGDGDDALWSNAENWAGGKKPTIDDRIVINKPMTVDVDDAQAAEIILDQSSLNTGKLTITAGNALLIAETLAKTTDGETKVATEAADVIINSTRETGVGALIIGGETGTNAATMNFETKAKNDGGWVNQFVGSPFSNNTPYVDYALQLYKFVPQANGDRGWWQTHTSGTMTPFWGYNVLYNDNNYLDVTWTGTLNASESKMISGLYYNGSSETDNMFANSWTAPIHVGAIEDADLVNASKTLYMFNAGTPAQEEGNDGSNAANDNTEPGTYISIPIHTATYAGIGVIPSMQAFYVLATGSDASITLDYNKVVYTPALTSVGIVPNRAPRRSVAADEPEVIKLRVQSESGWAANTYVMGRADFAESYEDGWDGAYIEGESATPKLYTPSIDGNMFINCLPEIEGTVVGFRKGTEDNYYTCSFEYNGEDTWYLNDLKEQKSTLINAAETYEFVAEPGDTETRFVISATPIHKITTGNESVGAEAAKVRKLIIDDKVYIIRGGRMYSVDGQMIK